MLVIRRNERGRPDRPAMMTLNTRKIPLAATLVVAASLSGALLATFAGQAGTRPDILQTSSVGADRCTGGSDVSRFVCRNGWMTFARHANR
jgi:hypothetical protein